MQKIGMRLKKVREAYNLTSAVFSKTLGINQSNLSRIENGQTPPSAKAIIAAYEKFQTTSPSISSIPVRRSRRSPGCCVPVVVSRPRTSFATTRCRGCGASPRCCATTTRWRCAATTATHPWPQWTIRNISRRWSTAPSASGRPSASTISSSSSQISRCRGGFRRCSASAHRRSEERRVGKECRSRWSPYH